MYTEYHSIFQFPHLMDKHNHDDFLSFYEAEMEKSTATNTIQKKIFSSLPAKLVFNFFKTSSDVIFVTDRFTDLLATKNTYRIKLISQFSLSMLTKKDNNVSYFPLYFFLQKIYFFYKTDPLLESLQAKKFIADTVTWLQSSSTKYLVTANDWLFSERFLIYCAKQANIKSICIQDGIFAKNVFTEAHKKYADYVFAWDTAQANLIKTRGYSDDQIRILGYPYNLIPHHQKLEKEQICLLGQPFENFSSELGLKKKQLFSKLIHLLNTSHKTIVYKPHPGEKDTKYFPEEVKLFRGSLTDAIAQFDVFISISSTTLLEVTLADKIAIQILDNAFMGDNMEETGYAYTVQSNEIDDIVSYIAALQSSFLPSCKVPIHENISEQFISLLKDL